MSPTSFDPSEFGIPPSALEATDTSQLLGLLAAKMALEDCGYGHDQDFDRDRTSVILGVTGTQELVIPLSSRLGYPKWRKALEDSAIDPQKAEEVIQRRLERLEGVAAVSVGGEPATATADDGSFRLVLEPGVWEIEVSHPAFRSARRLVTVGGEKSGLRIQLAPVERSLVFDTEPEEMWAHVVRSLGIEPATLVASRGVH